MLHLARRPVSSRLCCNRCGRSIQSLVILAIILLVTPMGSPASAAPGDVMATFDIQATQFLADPTRPVVYAALTDQDAIGIIDLTDLSLQTVSVGDAPRGLALSNDASTLYIANGGSTFLSVVDTSNLTLGPSINLPTASWDVEVGSDDGLYVLGNQLWRVDPFGGVATVFSTGAISVGSGRLAITPDQSRLFYGKFGSSPTYLHAFDTSTPQSPVLDQSLQTGSNGQDLTVSPDGRFVAYPNGWPYYIDLYDPADLNTVLGTLNTGAFPRNIAFSPDGDVAYTVNWDQIKVWSTSTFSQTDTWAEGEEPSELGLDVNGRFLFAGYGDRTVLYDTGRFVGLIPGVKNWTNAGGDNDYYNGANWSSVGVPVEDDDVFIAAPNGAAPIRGFNSPTIDDGGSMWVSGEATDLRFGVQDFLKVGEDGDGVLFVVEGADLTSGNTTFVADHAGSTGKITVTGAGSTFTTDEILAGINGVATIEVADGGRIDADEAWIALGGRSDGSRMTVTGTGSVVALAGTVSDSLRMGGSGAIAYLEVLDGAQLTTVANAVGLNGGRGEVVVRGDGSRWDASSFIDLGAFGAGSLLVEDGGTVRAANLGITSVDWLAVGTSDLTVTGLNSLVEITGDANVGKGYDHTGTGTGKVVVGSGAGLIVGDTLAIYSQGELVLEDTGAILVNRLENLGGSIVDNPNSYIYANQLLGFGSSMSFDGTLTMGHSGWASGMTLGFGQSLSAGRELILGATLTGYAPGQASMNLQIGARVTSPVTLLGVWAGSSGTVTIQTGATWTSTVRFGVGWSGSGTLNVNGGTLNTGNLLVGANAGSGQVNIQTGSDVDVADRLTIFATGVVELAGGSLSAATVRHDLGGTFLFNDGTLRADQFLGHLQQWGGTLEIGNSPGSMLIDGVYALDGPGTLKIDLAGTDPGSGFDYLHVTDSVLLGGKLSVVVDPAFTLDAGQTFEFLTFDGQLLGQFFNLTDGALVGTFGGRDLFIDYGPDFVSLFTLAALKGDYDADGEVGQDDLDLVLAYWGDAVVDGESPGAGWLNAQDVTAGLVGQDELAAVLQNWGTTLGDAQLQAIARATGLGADEVSGLVPEPATAGLLLVGMGLLTARIRRLR